MSAPINWWYRRPIPSKSSASAGFRGTAGRLRQAMCAGFRRGRVQGSASFESPLLTALGLFNAAGDLGVASGGYASLEAIVNLKPDFILVSQAGDRAGDEGQAFLLHPALERFYPPAKRIVIPERLTECGSVMLADALDVLVAELARVER